MEEACSNFLMTSKANVSNSHILKKLHVVLFYKSGVTILSYLYIMAIII